MSNYNLRIDVTKIKKEHLFEGKNGAKYLNVVLWENRDGVDSYGNSHMAVQELPRELRDAGQKGPILGNAKEFGGQSKPAPAPARRQSTPGRNPEPEDDSFDSVPF